MMDDRLSVPATGLFFNRRRTAVPILPAEHREDAELREKIRKDLEQADTEILQLAAQKGFTLPDSLERRRQVVHVHPGRRKTDT